MLDYIVVRIHLYLVLVLVLHLWFYVFQRAVFGDSVPNLYQISVAGAFSGMIETGAIVPLDVVKIRMQSAVVNESPYKG